MKPETDGKRLYDTDIFWAVEMIFILSVEENTPFFNPLWRDLKNIRPQQWNCQRLWASFGATVEMRYNHCHFAEEQL